MDRRIHEALSIPQAELIVGGQNLACRGGKAPLSFWRVECMNCYEFS